MEIQKKFKRNTYLPKQYGIYHFNKLIVKLILIN